MTEQWAGDRVTRWLAQAPGLERQLAPVSAALMDAAALRPGERVLDVGCGTGPTTREAASLVGPTGAVSGLDVADDMLRAAAGIDAPAGSAPLEWVCADVVGWSAPPASYDVVLSRFGMMFFSDPPAAMRTLATATRPGGRLAFAVWGPRDASPLFEVPYQAARSALSALGHPVPPAPSQDEGAYSWRDPAAVVPMLTGAGWRDVELTEHVLALHAAGGDPAGAARSALDFGPTRLLLAGADADAREAAVAAIEQALAAHAGADGQVVLDGSVRVVTARR